MKQFSVVRGMKALKTLGGLKRRASNSHGTQVHLDIYILVQERDRLEKEKHQVVSRLESINDRLRIIGDRVNELKSISEKVPAKKQNQQILSDREDSKTWQVKNLQY